MKLIIKKYLENKATSLEKKKLQVWVLKSKENKKKFKEDIILYLLDNKEYQKVDYEKEFEKFLEQINKANQKKEKVFQLSNFYKYVAILIVCLSLVYFANNFYDNTNIEAPITNDLDKLDSNTDEIVLTLEDGTKKVLNKEQEQISYRNHKSHKEVLVFNEIKVPKGQVFRLILSDSTIVWLNAESKLKYPKFFINSSKTRNVTLEGEAFFEVTSNKNKPFLVHTNNIEIEVLGTKFNVSSYKNDDFINTTLVEGSVNVRETDGDNAILLNPSFQASFQKNNTTFTSKKVNTLDFTAWMDKKIIFNDISFEKLVVKIERTYNVKIVNNNEKLKKARFTGQFDIESIETIFKALSISYDFKYTINNNNITIKEI